MYKFELQTEELSDIQTLVAAEDMKVMLWQTYKVIDAFLDKCSVNDLLNPQMTPLNRQANEIKQLLEFLDVKTN